MSEYWVEIDYEARYTIAYRIAAASPREAEEEALRAVEHAEELPIVERRVNMTGGWRANPHATCLFDANEAQPTISDAATEDIAA